MNQENDENDFRPGANAKTSEMAADGISAPMARRLNPDRLDRSEVPEGSTV